MNWMIVGEVKLHERKSKMYVLQMYNYWEKKGCPPSLTRTTPLYTIWWFRYTRKTEPPDFFLFINISQKASFEHNLIKRLCMMFLGIIVIIFQWPVHISGLKRIFVDLKTAKFEECSHYGRQRWLLHQRPPLLCVHGQLQHLYPGRHWQSWICRHFDYYSTRRDQ